MEENSFDELKTHQRGAGRVLRSKSPEIVTQEIYAHLLVYYAIWALINHAAESTDLDPDRVSYIRSIRVLRRQVTDQAAFSPDRLTDRVAVALAESISEILQRLNNRRLRVNPRVTGGP